MMISNKIKRINQTKKYKNIDFYMDALFGFGYAVKDGQMCGVGGYEYLSNIDRLPEEVEQTYCVSNKVLVYCKSTILYRLNGKSWVRACDMPFISKPFVAEFSKAGITQILVCQGTCGQVLSGESLTFSQPITTVSAVFKNRIITADGNNVYFSENLDVLEHKNQLQFGLLLQTPSQIGVVVAVCYIGNRIYLVCKHGICILDDCFIGNDFTSRVLVLPYLDVLEESVAVISNAIYLISGGKLCKVTNDGVQTFDVFSGDQERKAVCPVGKVDNFYICPTSLEGEYLDYAMIFDVTNNTFYYDYCMQGLSAEKGYCMDQQNGTLFKFNADRQDEGIALSWKSKVLDFSTPKPKRITKINLKAQNACQVKVKGSFGTAGFTCGAVEDWIDCNLVSDWFSIEIVGSNNVLPITSLYVQYDILEV